MSQFRISLGNALSKNIKKDNSLTSKVCDLINSKIESISKLDYKQIQNLGDESSAEYLVDDVTVMTTTYKKQLEQDKILIAVQAAHKTFFFPNYFSLNFIGKVLVDGIVIDKSGNIQPPDEELLFEFM